MTILDSLAAIAQARPDLVGRGPRDFCVGGHWLILHNDTILPQWRAYLLLWAYETAARKGLDFAVAQVAGECAGVCGPHRSEGHADPTAAALAALAAALTTTEKETT